MPDHSVPSRLISSSTPRNGPARRKPRACSLESPKGLLAQRWEERSENLYRSEFKASNVQPQKERDWLVTGPQRDGSVIFMVFVVPQSQFDRFQSTYEAMLKNVQL